MEKKKFMDGTNLGSKREPATNASSARDGAVTGAAKLDKNLFGDVSGGRREFETERHERVSYGTITVSYEPARAAVNED